MPRILVTGVSYFIGAQVALVALQRGYEVAATVSSRQEAERVRATLSKRLSNLDARSLSLVIISPIAYHDDLNALLKSISFEAVIYTCIPFCNHIVVRETVGTLQSVLSLVQRSAPSVKRFILTSSLSAILPIEGPLPTPSPAGHIYTESDWNPISWDKAASGDLYGAIYGSTTFAEKTAWEFMKTVQPDFELVTLCAPLAFGDAAQYIESIHDLDGSTAYLNQFISGSADEIAPQTCFHWVDVTDLAEAHIQAIERPAAGNLRFIICAGTFTHKQLAEIAKKLVPRSTKSPLLLNEPSTNAPTVATTRDRLVLGIEYVSLEESVRRAVESMRRFDEKLF